VSSGRRAVAALESEALLPGATYFREHLPTVGTSTSRRAARPLWLERLSTTLEACDLIFLDPDNGFETQRLNPGASKAGKSVALAELTSLRRPGRTLLVYHHQTRMRGGHDFELEHWGMRLRSAGFNQVDALRASAFSARAFFLLDATPDLRSRAAAVCDRWGSRLTWRPNLGGQGSVDGTGNE
jgi:hypothetical protein